MRRNHRGRSRPSSARETGRRVAAALGLLALASASLVGVATAAQAAPGTPGQPQPNSVVFEENFENGPGTAPVVLTSYVGAGGQTYTADTAWLTNCNGAIVNFNIPYTSQGNCANPGSSANLRQLAYGLGVHSGAANPNTNDVVAAYTEGNPGANAVEFQTVNNIPLAQASGRFLTFSVDTAAVNCQVSAPQYQFAFLNEGGTATNVGGVLNACASSTTVDAPAVGPVEAKPVNVGTYTSNGSVLFSGSSLGIRMTNANGSGVGNDAAFDNIRILDVTPQLDKVFSPASVVAGEVSTLTLTVTNTADLAAKNGWSLTDALPAGLTIADGAAATTCPAGVVNAPAGGTTITASGNLTAGLASCTITVNVTSPVAGSFTNGPDNITSTGLNPPADTTVVFDEQAPAIRVVKSATPTSEEQFTVGQAVTYSFVVTNTGNVALADVEVTDTGFTGTGTLSPVVCPAGAANLAPAASVTCTATYTVTQDDVDAGSITNSATATGTPPQGPPPVSPPSEVTIPSVDPAPALTIVKSSDVETIDEAGETITYSFLVTNTGNVTLNDVTVTDTDFSGTGQLSAITCPAGAASLAPNATVTCTATYVATQADVDAGEISNIASVTGTPPSPLTPPPVVPSNEVIVEVPPAPALTIDKTATPTAITAAGQTITYSFLVTNTGNVTLTNVTVTETDFSGTGDLSAIACPAGAASLAPGASVTCSATYIVTQADVDAGSVTNAATSTGTPPNTLTPPPVSPPDEVTVGIPPAPAITVVKSADEAAQDDIAVGQVITYSFLVTNTGNVTLADVEVVEGDFSGAGDLSAITCPAGAASLAPGAQVTCTATYTVVQADVDAGTVTNTATATGTPPTGPDPVSPESEVSVPSAPAPGLNVVKTASIDRATTVGQAITYSFVVTNTGNLTLTDIVVNETGFTGTGTLSAVTCPAGAASLAPGAQVTCIATYAVTQADLDAGSIRNMATAGGTTPGGDPFTSDPSIVSVETPGTPLAVTGGEVAAWVVVAALMLLASGGALLLIRRKRTTEDADQLIG
ncbi:DUF7507 domain-containing protein [Microbacterium hydrocarbonoxydans]|uniref:DUF7507 domain-containing protein n=1 Tax=Microbacterium hydrocarbonoxydans TaxID=273678 RepID=UPI00203BA85A|nr:LPXTG cell wall anchor domain-containing protein [Microbacterium hydrocarbonoxydans]MCM3778694.1 LPXTG cell wall anchor domain-containing protein [Microbacterium hydrocarbonoxydans]